jgi:hypothetical protein
MLRSAKNAGFLLPLLQERVGVRSYCRTAANDRDAEALKNYKQFILSILSSLNSVLLLILTNILTAKAAKKKMAVRVSTRFSFTLMFVSSVTRK